MPGWLEGRLVLEAVSPGVSQLDSDIQLIDKARSVARACCEGIQGWPRIPLTTHFDRIAKKSLMTPGHGDNCRRLVEGGIPSQMNRT